MKTKIIEIYHLTTDDAARKINSAAYVPLWKINCVPYVPICKVWYSMERTNRTLKVFNALMRLWDS
jgi:hypothetical protein